MNEWVSLCVSLLESLEILVMQVPVNHRAKIYKISEIRKHIQMKLNHLLYLLKYLVTILHSARVIIPTKASIWRH